MIGLDLFSGIGGITLALEPWVRPIAYCEKDCYCQAVLLSRMSEGLLPCAPIWDDIRTLDGRQFKGVVDIIYGGFPCQDISCVGSGKGLAGERSGLFFEVMRLAKEIQPAFIFLENVPAIRTNGLGNVIRELASLRYDCRWGMLSAFDLGAPHKRERWFCLARNAHGYRKPNCSLNAKVAELSRPVFDTKSIRGHERQRRSEKQIGGPENRFAKDWWEAEPKICRVVDGLPRRMDQLRGLGNSCVPAQAREAFKRLMFGE